jgi:hypothetical protein
MRWKKGEEELTAEEYRQKAQKQIELLKNQWKIFFRTGIIVVAAFIVMIVVSIAWFVSNTRVDATGAAIRPADMPFDLAAAGIESNASADRGTYDELLTVSPGASREIKGKKYWSTDGSHTSICWAVTPESNMNNTSEDGKPTGIEPGSYGKMTFYIIPNKDGPLKVTLELVLAGYQIADDKKNAENVTKNDLTEVTDPSLQQLLEGHILLFAGYNEKAGCYKGWISRDAGVWRMSLGSGTEAAVLESKSGKLTWNNTNAQKDTAYPVTIYWIWPERLESYLRKADGYSGKNPLLFPENPSSEENALSALPENLFATMSKVEKNSSSNRYFRWEDSAKFQENVTKDTLSQIREKFNPALYSMVAAYYDSADQYLGKNVQYVQLKLDAQ